MLKPLGKAVAVGAVSAFAVIPALAAPAVASPAAAPLTPVTRAPTTPVKALAEPTLHYGDKGAAVTRLQQRLIALHYDPGKADGKYGPATRYAVWALQKVNRLTPSSTVGPKTWAALAAPRVPEPLVPSGANSRAEVDIKRQLLYVYKSGALVLISHISSGSEKSYYSRGAWHKAHTPRGDFKVYRKAKGWETAPLGRLYKSSYFYGGYAIHGATSVPLSPASHGCVRTPMHTADSLATLLPIGMRVYVRG